MSDSFISQTFAQNKRLFALVYRFNCQPALDIHSDHLPAAINSTLLQQLRSSRRGERKLSRWIAEKWNLGDHGAWDFSNIRWRLVLLDYSTLFRLMQFLGAAACRQQIANILDHDQQKKLKADIGDDVYLFALKRATFLTKNLLDPLKSEPDISLPSKLMASGRECLASCLNDLPRELLDRLRLKFPNSLDLESTANMAMEQRITIWKNVKRILISEVDPPLAPCFN